MRGRGPHPQHLPLPHPCRRLPDRTGKGSAGPAGAQDCPGKWWDDIGSPESFAEQGNGAQGLGRGDQQPLGVTQRCRCRAGRWDGSGMQAGRHPQPASLLCTPPGPPSIPLIAIIPKSSCCTHSRGIYPPLDFKPAIFGSQLQAHGMVPLTTPSAVQGPGSLTRRLETQPRPPQSQS